MKRGSLWPLTVTDSSRTYRFQEDPGNPSSSGLGNGVARAGSPRPRPPMARNLTRVHTPPGTPWLLTGGLGALGDPLAGGGGVLREPEGDLGHSIHPSSHGPGQLPAPTQACTRASVQGPGTCVRPFRACDPIGTRASCLPFHRCQVPFFTEPRCALVPTLTRVPTSTSLLMSRRV